MLGNEAVTVTFFFGGARKAVDSAVIFEEAYLQVNILITKTRCHKKL